MHILIDCFREMQNLSGYIRYFSTTYLNCSGLMLCFRRIIYSTLFEGHVIIGAFTNIYYYYNGFLGTLQVLHIIWFYMILRMVFRFVIKGEVNCIVSSIDCVINIRTFSEVTIFHCFKKERFSITGDTTSNFCSNKC